MCACRSLHISRLILTVVLLLRVSIHAPVRSRRAPIKKKHTLGTKTLYLLHEVGLLIQKTESISSNQIARPGLEHNFGSNGCKEEILATQMRLHCAQEMN